MKRKVVAIAILLLIWLIAAGCGESRRSVAGRYLFGPRPEYYIDLKSNGEFLLGTTSRESPAWPGEWPMGVTIYPREGTWRLKDGSTVILRSSGAEIPFGEPQGNEIIDIWRSVWQRQ